MVSFDLLMSIGAHLLINLAVTTTMSVWVMAPVTLSKAFNLPITLLFANRILD